MISRACLLAAALALMPFVGSSGAAATMPALKVISVSGYALGVAGHGWSHARPTVVTLHAGPWTVGMEIHPAAGGSFKVGVQQLNICGGVWFKATDTAGHALTARSVSPLCASPSNPPRPVLKLLKGKQVSPTEHRLIAPHPAGSVTMKVGDTVYLWEPGTSQPSFSASADEKYLALLDQYQTPPRACPEADCAEGFAWRWVAIRPGTTMIDLSPACRRTTPPCEMPDFAIRIHITR